MPAKRNKGHPRASGYAEAQLEQGRPLFLLYVLRIAGESTISRSIRRITTTPFSRNRSVSQRCLLVPRCMREAFVVRRSNATHGPVVLLLGQ